MKRALESIGTAREEFRRVAERLDERGASPDPLVALGRALEEHEARLERTVRTLDEHKRVVRDCDDAERDALGEAMEAARHRARLERAPGAHDRTDGEGRR